jgi:hypothetical protein
MKVSKIGINVGKSFLYFVCWGVVTLYSCTVHLAIEFADKADEGIEEIRDIWRGSF